MPVDASAVANLTVRSQSTTAMARGSGNLGLTYELDDVILEDPDQDAHEPDSITALIMSVGQSME